MKFNSSSTNRSAVVLCVHHKPWLVMSTWITALVQDYQDFDVYVVYNVGDGSCSEKSSYDAYRQFEQGNGIEISLSPEIERESRRQYNQLARKSGINPQLSPFDERVQDVCRLHRNNVFELQFENDHALDSGTWYKFIRTGIWRNYDHVFFIQEGTLLTRTNVLSSTLSFMKQNNVHFVAAGHMKRRISKRVILNYNTYGKHSADLQPIDYFHNRMMGEVFEVFNRDREFKSLYERWTMDYPGDTEHHVPDIWGSSALWRRIRSISNSTVRVPGRWKWPKAMLRRFRYIFPKFDSFMARVGLTRFADLIPKSLISSLGYEPNVDMRDCTVYVNALRETLRDTVSPVDHDGVKFHCVDDPEWFGCSTNHVLSHVFLERFTEKLDQYSMYDVLDVPFSGTALEPLWGFLPCWLGFEKWFFDGYHRVAKNFQTLRREDDPEGMASYINRYHWGSLYVDWYEDYIKLKGTSSNCAALKNILPNSYF